MRTFATRTKNNGWYSCSGQESRIHPGGCAPNCGLTTGLCSCLAAYYLNNQCVLGDFKRLAHKGGFHRCFKIWISPCYVIEDALYFGFNTFRGFTRNRAAFYTEPTMVWIA